MRKAPPGAAGTSGREGPAGTGAAQRDGPFLKIRASRGSSVFGETPGGDWQKWAWKTSRACSGGS